MAGPAEADDFTTIQTLIWPEPGICTEPALYVRTEGAAALITEPAPSLRFAAGGRARFDTWFNLFNLGKWRRHCGLRSLRLELRGEGEFAVSVVLALSHRSWERVENRVVRLAPGQAAGIELDHLAGQVLAGGAVFLELTALSPGRFDGADWRTADRPRRQPELLVSVTTFKREAAVARSAARFSDYLASSPLKESIRMLVVDNGQSLKLPDLPYVETIPNENLGGAGGFSRGLLAARDRGATHCLFMDDDAAIHMESLARAWAFLAHAEDPSTAIAGAMINATHRWAIWENGARFFQRCRPLHMGTDLRDAFAAIDMEFATTGPVPEHFYGGWWFFAFPVAAARRQPFPFFVRGDDVSFSLVHDFDIVRLNGVVSFQDSFTDKESPLTWYLDLRSHMAHHLSLPALEIGRWGGLKIAAWFFLRNLPRMHYETLAAINLALEDVMRGPDFFAENADMRARRAEIKALTRAEAWAPVSGPLPPVRQRPPRRGVRLLMKLALNGHFLPFFSRFGRRITLEAENRGHIGFCWGAAEITVLSGDGRQSYTVRHSKARAARETWRFLRGALRFAREYDSLRDDWRGGYDRLTGALWWRRKLGL